MKELSLEEKFIKIEQMMRELKITGVVITTEPVAGNPNLLETKIVSNIKSKQETCFIIGMAYNELIKTIDNTCLN